MIKKGLKIIIINLFILIFLLLLIETSAYFGRSLLDRRSVGWLVASSDETAVLDNPCKKFRTHPFYGVVHDHNNECIIKEGYAVGTFVHYNQNYENSQILVTLGGSTTDGFFQHYSNGETWPLQLNKLFKDSNVKIINGGSGQYGSNKELLKLLTEVGNLPYNIQYIVSLNGINEIAGYDLTNKTILEELPFFSGNMVKMFSNEIWLKRDYRTIYFPSTISLFQYLLGQDTPARFIAADENFIPLNERAKKSILLKDTKKFSESERWFYNIKMMHNISKGLGAKYYVFLQPTFGLKGVQSKPPPKGTNDASRLLRVLGRTKYINDLNSFYDEARILCKSVNYCYDITNYAPPTGNMYANARHHNENGNAVIAKLIFDIIQNDK